jgi:ribosomal protein L37E
MKPETPIMMFALALGALINVSVPAKTPPGNVLTIGHLVAAGLILGGAALASYVAVGEVPRLKLLIYGCLGGASFLPVLLPDGRDWLGINFGQDHLGWYLLRTALCILGFGYTCVLIGWVHDRRMNPRPSDRCRQCGYLLIHLTEARCPECGTGFDPARLAQAERKPP